MILRDATIKYSGNDPDILSKGSHKRICVSCDICGRIRWCNYQSYKPLCMVCSRLGINNPLSKPKIIKICEICGKKFKSQLSANRKFCSNKCKNKWHSENMSGKNNSMFGKDIKITKICIICGEEFKTYLSQNHKYCSTICAGKYQSKNQIGKNNPNWNSNLTNEDRLSTRQYPEYHEWRLNVFKRDNFICRKCNDSTGGNLQAHHIEGYNSNKKLRISLDNGITLCEKCHKEFHHQFGRGNNTKEQFIEFMEIN